MKRTKCTLKLFIGKKGIYIFFIYFLFNLIIYGVDNCLKFLMKTQRRQIYTAFVRKELIDNCPYIPLENANI